MCKKTKIIFIHPIGYRGGAGAMLINVLAAFNTDKFDLVVICPNGDHISNFIKMGARVVIPERKLYQFSHYTGYSPNFFNPHFLYSIYSIYRDKKYWDDLLRSLNADIVWINSLTLSPMIFSVKSAKLKAICMVQETIVKGWFGVRTKFLKFILSKYFDAVIFISSFDKEVMRCKAKIVEVIPNWVDLSRFDFSMSSSFSKNELGIPEHKQVILFMGGVSKIKGTLELILAFAKLNNRENLTLLIAGYTTVKSINKHSVLHRLKSFIKILFGLDYELKVGNTIKKLGLEKSISFVGMRDDVDILYSACDLLVFPATVAHQARPVLEAGAMKKPVVVPNYNNITEFVINRYNGLTYQASSILDLSKTINEMLNNVQFSKQLGENNYTQTLRVHNKFINELKINNVIIKMNNLSV